MQSANTRRPSGGGGGGGSGSSDGSRNHGGNSRQQRSKEQSNTQNTKTANPELIKFIYESWDQVIQEYRNGATYDGAIIYLNVDNDKDNNNNNNNKIPGFRPFDVDSWIKERVYPTRYAASRRNNQ